MAASALHALHGGFESDVAGVHLRALRQLLGTYRDVWLDLAQPGEWPAVDTEAQAYSADTLEAVATALEALRGQRLPTLDHRQLINQLGAALLQGEREGIDQIPSATAAELAQFVKALLGALRSAPAGVVNRAPCFAVAERAHTLLTTLREHVCTHPSVATRPELVAACERAERALDDLHRAATRP